jgi:hypothetical protein
MIYKFITQNTWKCCFLCAPFFSLFWKTDKIVTFVDLSGVSNSKLCSSHFITTFFYIFSTFYMYLHLETFCNSLFHIVAFYYNIFLWRCDPTRVMTSSFLKFLDHTQQRTTVGKTPLDEWSARCRDLYLTTHNTHNRQTSTPPVKFELTISAGERPQTYALERTATGTSYYDKIII